MEYKNPADKIKAHDDNGYRVSNVNPDFKFPTDASLKAALMRINELAQNHAMKPCPNGDECLVCFMTKASAESDLLENFGEQFFHELLGPMAHAFVSYPKFHSLIFVTLWMGMEIAKSAGDVTKEVDSLKKMFELPSPSDEKTA